MKRSRLSAGLAVAAVALIPIAGLTMASNSATAATPANAVKAVAEADGGAASGPMTADKKDERFFGVVKAVARGFTAAKAPQAAGRVLQQAGFLGYSSTSGASKTVEAAYFDN